MVNLGKDNSKDELIKELADMLERLLHGEIGCGPKNVSENEVNQLVNKARVLLGTSKTMNKINNLLGEFINVGKG